MEEDMYEISESSLNTILAVLAEMPYKLVYKAIAEVQTAKKQTIKEGNVDELE